jgi:multimeric flavodoxin WrbA
LGYGKRTGGFPLKIAVISGSPKGENSFTLQSVRYLAKQFPRNQFEIHHVGQQIKQLEKADKWSSLMDDLIQSDLILWVYPVYTFIAPYQLHRFIELLKAHPKANELAGKWSSQLTTSKHFFDFTAHRYVEDNATDLGLKVIRGFSADMDDLLSMKGQEELIGFWRFVLFEMGLPDEGAVTTAQTGRQPDASKSRTKPFDTVILTSADGNDLVLLEMINTFRRIYPHPTRVINIRDLRIDGGCLGCFNCATDGKCVYKDGFDQVLRDKIQTTDALVYAATIKDHSLGSVFKLYDDRQFCNGHRTVNMGMPVGYLLAGNYSQETNLRLVIEGRNEVGHQFLAGVATSESQDEGIIQAAIGKMAKTMAYALEHNLLLPQNFLGIGGMKILRDLVYLAKGLMKADHRFYKANGFYDFPQNQIRMRLRMQLLGSVMALPSMKKNLKSKLNQAILKPYLKVIDKS